MHSEVDKAKSIFEHFMKVNNLKNTKERGKVVDAICNIHSHFDVRELMDLFKERGISISQATVYRTLGLLVESGLLKKLSFDDSYAQYEYALGAVHHDHLICLECNAIIEFVDDMIEERQSIICERYNFKEVEHSLQIFGLCKDCNKES